MTNTTPIALAVRLIEQDNEGFNTLIKLSDDPRELLLDSLKWNAMFIKKAADTMDIEPGDLGRTLINQIEMADFNDAD